ncbi:DUF4112 domain-containing protein [Pleurocapsa sp. PCC 7319]|uniref:DUF4112 domain-containing protein n=1 Tax=Pleurocapsa sp. PCC 7319 TaxID=118161 RepID=UPI0003454E68|nr:DUF4112 domain-containing protein [Pleurocapsa sp. PCC 7319]
MDKTQQLKNLQRIRKITNLLDSAIGIPGTKFRIGLDPILGLFPGGGDLIGAIISAYMIYLAAHFGLKKEEIGKMAGNVAIETILGSIPLVGDLFDAYFKANSRNLEILENHIENSNSQSLLHQKQDSKLETQVV